MTNLRIYPLLGIGDSHAEWHRRHWNTLCTIFLTDDADEHLQGGRPAILADASTDDRRRAEEVEK